MHGNEENKGKMGNAREGRGDGGCLSSIEGVGRGIRRKNVQCSGSSDLITIVMRIF